ncbi:MAG: hypothetical protein ACLFVC_09115, partial [Opitutales bacterium]
APRNLNHTRTAAFSSSRPAYHPMQAFPQPSKKTSGIRLHPPCTKNAARAKGTTFDKSESPD